MTLLQMIYKLLIGPLELLFEVIFVVANRVVSNPGYAIIALSLAMNVLVLPLYRRADAMQEEERVREEKMRPWIDHIKKTFKGDERFMMLQTYYRQNNYRPTDGLKGSISLLLEIPFFIAAYRFLSHLELLKGVAFGPITDLGSPDQLIALGDIRLNLLPILMTLINIAAAAIYMKGMPLKNKIQMYGIAAIFLVLLYNSPAGLVFYWTLNNVFSLCKNIFYKMKNPQKVLSILLSVVGIIMLLVVFFVHPMRSLRSQAMVVMLLLLMQLPILMPLFKKTGISIKPDINNKQSDLLFNSSMMLLVIVTGILIPSAVIVSSTEEFFEVTSYISPLWYILSAFLLAAGTFLLWFGIFYRLSTDEGKHWLAIGGACIAIIGLSNYFLFGNKYGIISANLKYEDHPHVYAKEILINTMIALAIIAVLLLLWKYRKNLVTTLTVILCSACLVMGIVNVVQISKVLIEDREVIKTTALAEPELTFSKDGQNVIFIMVDRMSGYMIPYMLNERPDLIESFDGFEFFTNAVSYGQTTNTGSPALFGGYDYRPEQMNERKDMLLKDKHDEALRVMPELFSEAGYDVTICDPSYAGYKHIPDMTIYDDHPEFHKYILTGRYSLEEFGYTAPAEANKAIRLRNFFCYSIFRIAPSIAKITLYEHGGYNQASTSAIGRYKLINSHKATGNDGDFMKHYATLCHLPDITKTASDGKNRFIFMTNDTSHEPEILKLPEYEPAAEVDNTEYDEAHPNRVDKDGNVMEFETDFLREHYHCGMATLIKLAEYMDYLKEQGVYDNTRIIIASDHGTIIKWDNDHSVYYIDEDTGKEEKVDIRRYDCCLMVKDFGAKGFTENGRVATNADTPALAIDGILDNPKNPFTGSPITTFDSSKEPIHVTRTGNYLIGENNGTQYLRAWWFEVHGDSNKVENWKYIGKK